MAKPPLATTRLSRHLCSVVVLLGIACGGTTESPPQASGGSATGGAGASGHATGGSASGGAGDGAAAASNGGSQSAGAAGYKSYTGGSLGVGGSIVVGGSGVGGVGGATVDARCPERLPTAMPCTASDVGATCKYDLGTGCLCYPNASASFVSCQKVDATCPEGGLAGAGGFSPKIALPPLQVCGCSASNWTCEYGI